MKKMKEHFLNSSINFLQKYNTYSEKEVTKLRYGLEGLYLTLTKLIVIFGVSLLIGMFKEVLIVLILFNIIRYFGFGFHAEKSSECLVLSLLNFILIPYILLNMRLSITAALIIASICLINYLLFAPADTIKRPLKNKKKRLVRKILTIGTGVIYTMLIFFINNYDITALILSALLIQVIMICPLTYMIFKQPYNNYKNVN